MIIKDMMPNFELYQPTQLKDAYGLLDRFGKDAWKMAGGYDSLVVQGTRQAAESRRRPRRHCRDEEVKETADGIEIGALTTLTEVSTNPIVVA
ncbi:MAG: FAD binding domain-containing protein [Bauldia sp.]